LHDLLSPIPCWTTDTKIGVAMKDFATVLLASLFVVFVLISLFSVERRTQGYELASSYGKIADSADELLETVLLYQRK